MGNDLHNFGPHLPGVKRKYLRGPLRRSITAMMVALYSYRVVSDAGDHGSAMVYRDDDGNYRCLFQVYHQALSTETFTTRAAVTRWLKEWHPKQRPRSALAGKGGR